MKCALVGFWDRLCPTFISVAVVAYTDRKQLWVGRAHFISGPGCTPSKQECQDSRSLKLPCHIYSQSREKEFLVTTAIPHLRLSSQVILLCIKSTIKRNGHNLILCELDMWKYYFKSQSFIQSLQFTSWNIDQLENSPKSLKVQNISTENLYKMKNKLHTFHIFTYSQPFSKQEEYTIENEWSYHNTSTSQQSEHQVLTAACVARGPAHDAVFWFWRALVAPPI